MKGEISLRVFAVRENMVKNREEEEEEDGLLASRSRKKKKTSLLLCLPYLAYF